MTAAHKTQGDGPVFLIGFMGAGKTTVGRVLARKLDYDFFDLDERIEAAAGKAVQEIFAESGELEFRRLESEAIRSCNDLKRTVVSLGGGAYEAEANRVFLRMIGSTIWLDCPIEICLARIKGDQSRPLAGDEDEMRLLLERRRPAYAQAEYVVRTGQLLPEEIASEIATLLGK